MPLIAGEDWELLKNIKLVLLALGVFFGGFKNKIASLFGKKKQEEGNYASTDSSAVETTTEDTGEAQGNSETENRES